MILDVNCYDIFINQKNEAMKLIHKWLKEKGGKLVYSNHEKIRQHINRNMKKRLLEYGRAGGTKQVSKEKVEQSMVKIKRKHHLKSNDLPILGLAFAGEAKILCSSDKKLHYDFIEIIPHGKVYQTQKHKHLLQNDICP